MLGSCLLDAVSQKLIYSRRSYSRAEKDKGAFKVTGY